MVVSIVDFEQIKQAAIFGVKGESLVVSPNAHQLTEIADLLITGKIKVRIGEILPLKEAEKAHRLIRSSHSDGKILLKP